MIYICIGINNHFHINGFALSLALKQRLVLNEQLLWRWSIVISNVDCSRAQRLSFENVLATETFPAIHKR